MKGTHVRLLAIASVVIIAMMLSGVGLAGEWHTGTTNACSDCHTMHYSMNHNWDGTTPVSTTPQANGNWLGATGPNHYLLKAPANQLCLACHDGQTFAPDVMGVNVNTSPTEGRSAGALNEAGLGAPYDEWKGHTLDSTAVPPGFNPAVTGLSASSYYDPAGGLECTSCHTQHGTAGIYRNVGPRSLTAARPTYAISPANDTTKDVWINMDPATYTPNTGDPATFNPLYASANIRYNRNDAVVGTTKTSNKMDTFCATCHGNFHGGGGDTEIGGVGSPAEEFLRHPTSQVTIGALSGGHSSLSRYTGATTKSKVYASDHSAYTDASPGCVSCHKAHGNQNAFGLIFTNRTSTSVGEEGGYASGQTVDLQQGYRNLCGQCHGQGN